MKILMSTFLCLLVVDYSFCTQKKPLRLPPQDAQDLIHAINVCMPDSRVPLDALLKVVDGGYVESKNFRNFIYCCYKNANYLGPDGLIDIERSANVFSKEKPFVEGVRRCGRQQVGSNPTEAVFNFFKCFQDTVPYKLTI